MPVRRTAGVLLAASFLLASCGGTDRLSQVEFPDAQLHIVPTTIDAGSFTLPDAEARHPHPFPDAGMPDTGGWHPVFEPGDHQLHIVLVWNPDVATDWSDIDLHLLHPDAVAWESHGLDCYYADKDPTWDADPTASPTLDHDITTGHGPENILLQTVPPAEFGRPYRVGVHHFSDHGFGPSVAYIGIFCQGSITQLGPVTLQNWELWRVADLTFSADGCIVQPLSHDGMPWVEYLADGLPR